MAALSAADRELIDAATDVLRTHYDPERHTTGAALRTAAGSVHTAVSLKANTPKADVHAEPIAVASALLDGETAFDTVVAVQFPTDGPDGTADPRVVSACGVCRELLVARAPDISVIVDDGGLEKRPIATLLPA